MHGSKQLFDWADSASDKSRNSLEGKYNHCTFKKMHITILLIHSIFTQFIALERKNIYLQPTRISRVPNQNGVSQA